MTIFLDWCKAKIRRGFSPIALIVGEMRVGKTCTALTLAYGIDKNFNPEEQMFFTVRDYLNAVKKFDHKVLILDEAGVELDSYRYSDARQRAFSHIIQSQAYKQNTLFIVLPHPSDFAKCHRKYVKALLVIPSRGRYIFYSPAVRYWDLNDLEITAKKIENVFDVPMPPAHIYNAYKQKYEKQIKEGILNKEIAELDKYLGRLEAKPMRADAGPSLMARLAGDLPNLNTTQKKT